jgi:hypothetical protein
VHARCIVVVKIRGEGNGVPNWETRHIIQFGGRDY